MRPESDDVTSFQWRRRWDHGTMAGAAVGRLEVFNEDNESITQYLERVELYFEANGIKAEKQRAVFLSVIGR